LGHAGSTPAFGTKPFLFANQQLATSLSL